MPSEVEYAAEIGKLGWSGLRKLWRAIGARDTPGWQPGKAFEYLVLRALELDGGDVRWPYSDGLADVEEVEQIDGSVHIGNFYCLLESKDEIGNISIGPIAKLRNQLLRRPAVTVGLVFSSNGFSDAAVMLANFTMPQAILLWTGSQVEYVLKKKKVLPYLEQKYRLSVDEGMPDYDISAP